MILLDLYKRKNEKGTLRICSPSLSDNSMGGQQSTDPRHLHPGGIFQAILSYLLLHRNVQSLQYCPFLEA